MQPRASRAFTRKRRNPVKRTIARGVGGLLLGYLIVALFSVATTSVLRLVWPTLGTGDQSTGLLMADLAYSLLYGLAGGAVAFAVGRWPGAWLLAGVLLVLGVVSASAGWDTVHPSGYQWLIAVGSPAMVALGAMMAARQRVNALRSLDGSKT